MANSEQVRGEAPRTTCEGACAPQSKEGGTLSLFGKSQASLRSFQSEPLEAFVGAIGHDDGRFTAGMVIDSDAVRSVELSVASAGFAEHRFPLDRFSRSDGCLPMS